MRNLIIILFTLITCSVSAQQNGKFDIEAYKNEQHNFIQKAVKFTQKEAAAFFPLYDELRTKEFLLYSKGWKFRDPRNMTEEQCRKMIIDRDNTSVQLKKLQMQYHKRMLNVVPAAKLMAAIHAGEEFDRMKVRQQFNGGKAGRPKMQHGPGHHPRNDGKGPWTNNN